ncbi:MAG: Galactose/methyl galactoside import ATP-binding protein MglA [Alphaproteobacteria bacterium MarineAlpha11_Bin1]|nr:MAG: Galactose/methyl galactoside import ATP-binding protein MglA [Alphaproteobacteria bacterium MarineAlpha11_Bin1]|tara:strand:+ start:1222 stop:2754 length:1533 start_codon:yes stop_codon:yes gene_type:complete
MSDTPRLELVGINKVYPGVVANKNVSLRIMPGEIHALLGENGAGKSTLVKFIYGVQTSDSGRMLWEGEEVCLSNPNAARKIGIAMVFQHFSLFEAMTVEENISLGISPELTKGDLSDRIRSISAQYGLPLDPNRHVHTLSVGERQRIEVVRCLLQDPTLLIMDEPTSVLTPQEAEELFKTLRRLSDEGVSILYISHKLEEIKVLCHTATIMRMGEVVSNCIPSNETPRSMAEMMMGENLMSPQRPDRQTDGTTRLQVRNLTAASTHQHGTALHDICIQVRAGEIVGIAGIAGNGQRELMEILTGEVLAPEANKISIDGTQIGRLDPVQRRRIGLGLVPEERLGHGAVSEMSLWENGLLSGATRMNLIKNGFIGVAESSEFAQEVVEEFRVKTPGVNHTAKSLSGGNLQKFIVGREIVQKPGVIVVLQPTWGVDAGSAAAIRQSLIDMAAAGTAVLVISQDLEELFQISDRIAVICRGRLSEARAAENVTPEEVGLLMAGAELDGDNTGAG